MGKLMHCDARCYSDGRNMVGGGPRRSRRRAARAAVLGASVILVGPAPAFANFSVRAEQIRASHAAYQADFGEVELLERRPIGRDAYIAQLESMVPKLLEGSSLEDADYLQGADCGGGSCTDLYGLPPVPAGVNWRKGFSAVQVIAQRTKAPTGQDVELEDGVVVMESGDGTTIQREGVFTLRVYGDGHSFTWVNHLNGYGKYSNAPAVMSEKEAEEHGRRVLDELGAIRLGPAEELVFIKARQIRFTGQDADPGDRPVATEAYFGRVINGIPVVGYKGSTVKIEFIANANIHRLVVDWSPMAPANGKAKQTMAPKEQLKSRFARRSPNAKPVACGYFDPGSPRGSHVGVDLLQLGCMLENKAASQRYFVPAATVPAADPAWPAALADRRAEGFDPPGQGRLSLSNRAAPRANDTAEDVFNKEPDTGESCSLAATGAGARFPLGYAALLGALLAGTLYRRRARQRLPRKWARALLAAGGVSLCVTAAKADYATFMFKYFDDPSLDDFTDTQWENFWDWKAEMDDIADCIACWGDTPYLPELLNGNMRATGIQGSIVAVDTHGANNSQMNQNYEGRLDGHEQSDWVFSHGIEPDPSYACSTEIMMFGACDFMTNNNTYNWYGFRNAHRFGMRVMVGCWGPCYAASGITNNTWNEIGDEIADKSTDIWDAWKEGYSVLWADDDIETSGLGKKSAADCDERARNVSYQDRNQWADYSYGHDEPITGLYELCGYYQSNW